MVTFVTRSTTMNLPSFSARMPETLVTVAPAFSCGSNVISRPLSSLAMRTPSALLTRTLPSRAATTTRFGPANCTRADLGVFLRLERHFTAAIESGDENPVGVAHAHAPVAGGYHNALRSGQLHPRRGARLIRLDPQAGGLAAVVRGLQLPDAFLQNQPRFIDARACLRRQPQSNTLVELKLRRRNVRFDHIAIEERGACPHSRVVQLEAAVGHHQTDGRAGGETR